MSFASDNVHYFTSVLEEGRIVNSFQLPDTNIRPLTTRFTVIGYRLPNYDDGYGNILGTGVWGSVDYASGIVNIFSQGLPSDKEHTIEFQYCVNEVSS